MPDGMHKALLPLPGGTTMLANAVDLYTGIGIKRFVFLTKQDTQNSVLSFVRSRKQRRVIYHHLSAPESFGKGAAVRYALVKRTIPNNTQFIVHNPDDVIVGAQRCDIITTAISRHLNFIEEGCIATLVSVEGTTYPYTSYESENNRITHIERHAFVSIKTHVGITIFSPAAAPYFLKNYLNDTTSDFEVTLFPLLARRGSLYLTTIPVGSWLSVNTQKELEQLRKML